jgi:hypothetical protein
MSIQTYYLCRCKLSQHRAFISPHSRPLLSPDVEALPYHGKAPRSSHSPSQSSRSRPCSDLAVRRTSRVLLDTCSLGGLEVGRHLSRRSLVTCFGARSPVKRFTCRLTTPSSSILGRRHLSGTSSKSPLYIICIRQLLLLWAGQSPNPCNHYTEVRPGSQARPKIR